MVGPCQKEAMMPRKRKSGEGGLYHDAKRDLWIGVVEDGLNASGGRKQRRVSSRSQKVALVKLDALKDEIKNHGSPLGNQTVAEWGAFWLDGYKYKKPQTYRTYKSLMKTWVLPQIGRKNVKDVRPSDLRRIYDNIRSAGRSSSTAVKVHNMMSGLFDGARVERLVSHNVVSDIKPPKAAKVGRDTFTPDETLSILQAATGARDGSKWVTSLYAGIRQGERIGATIDSVDLRRGLFTVEWSLVEGNYEHGCGGTCTAKAAGHCPKKRLLIPEGIDYRVLKGRLMLVPPKSGESRTFPLPASLVDVLAAHIAELDHRPNPYGLLWPAADGSPMSGRTDQAEWKALLEAAGVDRPAATTHWARHTAISDFTASGVSDRVIGEVVGHRSPGVTGRYQHVSSKDAADAMGKLAERRQIEG
jgi:integrase